MSGEGSPGIKENFLATSVPLKEKNFRFSKILCFARNTITTSDSKELRKSLQEDAEVQISRSVHWVNKERTRAAENILKIQSYRNKYMFVDPQHFKSHLQLQEDEEKVDIFPMHIDKEMTSLVMSSSKELMVSVQLKNGVYVIVDNTNTILYSPISIENYLKDFDVVLKLVDDPPTKTFTMERLQELEHRFNLHLYLDLRKVQVGNNFFECPKVDTHIHANWAAPENNLFKFIKENKDYQDDVFVNSDKKRENLNQFCQRHKIDLNRLSIHQIGEFENDDSLCSIFLKTTNLDEGKLFAKLLKEELSKIEETQTYTEMRLIIMGNTKDEWEKLSHWVISNKVVSSHNKFLIEFHRFYENVKEITFSEYISRFFKPIFEATLHPEQHKELSLFLQEISGFDSDGDEGVVESITLSSFDPNLENQSDPSYYVYMYYFYSNITSLNLLRMAKGLNTFDFRPHCGKTGHYSHLVAGYLTSKGVSQAVKLEDNTTLQYLFYLDQIGISQAPMATHAKITPYSSNPFNTFFAVGLNVSLSTDKPLRVHKTVEPLLEEYSMAKNMYKYKDHDLVEICRNSVRQCGFSFKTKSRMMKGFVNHLSRPAFRRQLLSDEEQLLKALTENNANGVFEDIPRTRVFLNFKTKSGKDVDIMKNITYFISLREKYLEENETQFVPTKIVDLPTTTKLFYSISNGVYNVFDTPDMVCDVCKVSTAFIECFDCRKKFCKKCFKKFHENKYHSIHLEKNRAYFPIIDYTEYTSDYNSLTSFVANGDSRSFGYIQLKCREEMFTLHKLLNNSIEATEMKNLKEDFDASMKIDTVLTGPRSFHPRKLLKFIQDKLVSDAEKIVYKELEVEMEDGFRVFKKVTLKNMFNIYNINRLNLETLDVSFDPSVIQRYDLWDSRERIFNRRELRNLFLTTNNLDGGKYLGELLKETWFNGNQTRSIKMEIGLGLNGGNKTDVERLAKMLYRAGILQSKDHLLSIQVVREYAKLKHQNIISCFEKIICNIFGPLFEATLNPENNFEVSELLKRVGSFDTKGDESVYSVDGNLEQELPSEYNSYSEPSFQYWIYFLRMNISVLNNLRKSLGLNTFAFRPHCGEAGDPMHNAAAFLTADSISHGRTLDDQNMLQYLFILAQIGITCCPIYDKFLYDIIKHPFNKYFMRGMLVTLATDSPMHSHTTDQPLIEEYANAVKTFGLTATDVNEIAQNSVVISSYTLRDKLTWLIGKNGESLSVPKTRLKYREKVLKKDVDTLLSYNIGTIKITEEERKEVMKGSFNYY
ncbi:AMP deaminase, putative [Entamoeba invadens IP1]|uniref:AMP deaminase, putative n=1 Tax=Entamoeba invadens IP1 TaxID=370355 RepID=A0A0A1U218_ENTIV|nr:AMP deaminase, putative [Entamoeba invadens IP1]ELP88097.1 AMP deaminase, putative [Entamoeba invadens IP1]|eukprot:XP_004254868.1 AMP deaminase, putative [Entamoeba invadens IP1]